ncbi:MAG: hypothetical protein ACR2H2_08100, partial [Solirubrobacteraceae bacterium]
GIPPLPFDSTAAEGLQNRLISREFVVLASDLPQSLQESRTHVVLSRRDPQTGKWGLVRWHAGVVDVLPVAQRSVPFDADAGPDRSGKPVVVYSRCRQDPAFEAGRLAPAADWQTARGCDLYELPLTGQPEERKLVAASTAGASETTPSIWRGALAFARHADGGSVPSILYLAAGATRARRLGAGSVQTCGGAGLCGFGRRHDGIDQLDLGPSRAAYVWRMTGGSVYGTGVVWELRAAPLAGGPSTLLDTGLISGTCGFSLPSAPSASRSPIAYLDAGADCDVTETRFATSDPVTGRRAAAATPGGLAAGAVRDGSTIYWLRVSNPAALTSVPGAGSCSVAAAQCQLVASSLPVYGPLPAVRQGSPADIDVARSDMGYRWVPGPAGTRLLRPPARVPCAPSSQATFVYTSARWSTGHHTVRVLRQDPRKAPRAVGSPQKRSNPIGLGLQSRLLRCGDRTRFTYVVTTGRTTRRVTFAVARAAAPSTQRP